MIDYDDSMKVGRAGAFCRRRCRVAGGYNTSWGGGDGNAMQYGRVGIGDVTGLIVMVYVMLRQEVGVVAMFHLKVQ